MLQAQRCLQQLLDLGAAASCSSGSGSYSPAGIVYHGSCAPAAAAEAPRSCSCIGNSCGGSGNDGGSGSYVLDVAFKVAVVSRPQHWLRAAVALVSALALAAALAPEAALAEALGASATAALVLRLQRLPRDEAGSRPCSCGGSRALDAARK